MTLVAICATIPQRMHLSGTVVEIWWLKHNGVTTLNFWRHVMSWARDHSTPGGRLPMGGL